MTKPFNLEKAKKGFPVCTRDGRSVRILCFDRKDCEDHHNILALVPYSIDEEFVYGYTLEGRADLDKETDEDLMMKGTGEDRSGWVNVYRDADGRHTVSPVFDTYEEAYDTNDSPDYIDTVEIKWEE